MRDLIIDSFQFFDHSQVYYELYTKARKKAKELKKNAIQAFLDAKNIKQTYMLDDLDESDNGEQDPGYMGFLPREIIDTSQYHCEDNVIYLVHNQVVPEILQGKNRGKDQHHFCPFGTYPYIEQDPVDQIDGNW